MVKVHIYVDKGDLVGDGHGKPFREFVISYRKIRRSSDLGLAKIKYMSTGYAGSAGTIARTLAKAFHKDGHSVRIRVSDCGKKLDGAYDMNDRGEFRRDTG